MGGLLINRQIPPTKYVDDASQISLFLKRGAMADTFFTATAFTTAYFINKYGVITFIKS